MKPIVKTAFCILLCTLLLYSTASAALPYQGYNYNAWNQAVPAPVGYEPVAAYGGMDIGGQLLKSPSAMCITDDGTVYLADTGNNRIVVCDTSFKQIRVISDIQLKTGTEPLSAPSGLFVDGSGQLFVAQPDKQRVVMLDKDGKLLATFERPDTDLIPANIEFKPTKVLVNKLGTVFVLVNGLYLGAITYDTQGKFLGFYGANKVEITLELLGDYLWKKLLTQQQINKMQRYVPIQYSGFDIDEDNFIYTCTSTTSTSRDEVKKLNALGNNVLIQDTRNIPSSTGDYGDIEKGWFMGKLSDTQLTDICVNGDGLIFGLDLTRGRIFEYDQGSQLLNIFGASGSQLGSFKKPVALDDYQNRLYVLDQDKGTVTEFAPTEYGAMVEKAVLLHNDGRYAEAKTVWESVLRLNVNCEPAYAGIGKALYEEGRYKEAIPYFEYGYDREGYSRAYREYRIQWVRTYIPFALTALLALIAVWILWKRIRRFLSQKKPSRKQRRDTRP